MFVKVFVVIVGVGLGIGGFVVCCFVQLYLVVFLVCIVESYELLVQEINSSGGRVIGILMDVLSEESVKFVFKIIVQEYFDVYCVVVIYNVFGGFVRKLFFEIILEDFEKGWGVIV